MSQLVHAFAPGRVNLIGEHTDYNDGLALPFAIEDGVTVTATLATGGLIEAIAIDLGERDSFDAASPQPAAGWRAFVRGAAAELRDAGFDVRPARLELSGTVPRGSGLSSSAALEIALCLALLGLAGDEPPEAVALARICSAVEHRWVGAQTGLLDQLASLCGAAGTAVRIDFRSLAIERLPLALGEHRLVVLDSGERHAHAESGYNERRSECARACTALGIDSLRDAEPAAVEELPEPLRRRARHVLSENARVDAAVTALRAGDLDELGRLLDASHASLRDDYAVSTAAVELAVARLRDAGALGARIMGGGFGGSVLALLPPGAAAPAGAVEVRPGAGARLL